MDIQDFESLVMEYKKIRFNDGECEKADSLLEQIADLHTKSPKRYEPVLKKLKVSY